MKSPILFIALTALILGSCAPVIKAKNPQYVASPDAVSLRLAEAADRASRSLETLAKVEKAQKPNSMISPLPNAPQELRRAMSFDWVGPVESITENVANRASYSFTTFGNKPVTPIIATVRAQNRQIIDVLRDIGLQMGTRATLKVNEATRSVEIHYAPTVNLTLDDLIK